MQLQSRATQPSPGRALAARETEPIRGQWPDCYGQAGALVTLADADRSQPAGTGAVSLVTILPGISHGGPRPGASGLGWHDQEVTTQKLRSTLQHANHDAITI